MFISLSGCRSYIWAGMVEILHSIKAFDVPRLVAFHCEHCLLLLQKKEGETNWQAYLQTNSREKNTVLNNHWIQLEQRKWTLGANENSKWKHANCPRIGDNGWPRWGWYLGLVLKRLRGLFDSQLRHGWGTVCLKFLTMQVFGNKFKLDLTGLISSLYLAEFTAKMIITSLITPGCDNLWQCHDVQGYCSLTSFI